MVTAHDVHYIIPKQNYVGIIEVGGDADHFEIFINEPSTFYLEIF